MLTYDKEKQIALLCAAFRKISRKSTVMLLIQLVIDFYIISSFFWGAVFGKYLSPFIILAVIAAKAVITLVKQNVGSCVVCIILNCAALVLGGYFRLIDYGTIVLIGFAFIVYGARIKLYCIIDHFSHLHGFPSFNTLVITDKIKSDEEFEEEIVFQYDLIKEDTLVRNEIKSVYAAKPLKILLVLAAVLITVGTAVTAKNSSELINNSSAKPIDSFEHISDGSYIQGSVDTIYIMSGSGLDSNTSDRYWCDFNGQCVTIDVPDYYKEEFASLYRYYAAMKGFPIDDGGRIFSDGGAYSVIRFTAKVRYIDKYNSEIINTAVFRKNEIPDDIITDLYIEILNVAALKNQLRLGIIFVISGCLIYISVKLIIRHSHDFKILK